MVNIFVIFFLVYYSGNLVVYPGTHVKHAEYFKEHSPTCLLEKRPFEMPNIDLPKPCQVRYDDSYIV